MQVGIDSFAAFHDVTKRSVSPSERLRRLVEQIERADQILTSASVTSICMYLLTCLYRRIMGNLHLLDKVELPLKKLLSSFTTTSGCSSAI